MENYVYTGSSDCLSVPIKPQEKQQTIVKWISGKFSNIIRGHRLQNMEVEDIDKVKAAFPGSKYKFTIVDNKVAIVVFTSPTSEDIENYNTALREFNIKSKEKALNVAKENAQKALGALEKAQQAFVNE